MAVQGDPDTSRSQAESDYQDARDRLEERGSEQLDAAARVEKAEAQWESHRHKGARAELKNARADYETAVEATIEAAAELTETRDTKEAPPIG